MSFWNNLFTNVEPTVRYCELQTTGLIARPGYFLSNLPFIIIGFYILAQKGKYAKVFGTFSILIGIASSVYDASFRYYAQVIDLNVMFAFVNFLLILNFHKIFTLTRIHKIRLFIEIQLLFLLLILILKGGTGSLLFGLAVVSLVTTQIVIWKKLNYEEKRFWFLGFASFIVGWLAWQLDANQIWCDINNIVNGRGIFHLLTSISILMLWKHYSLSHIVKIR